MEHDALLLGQPAPLAQTHLAGRAVDLGERSRLTDEEHRHPCLLAPLREQISFLPAPLHNGHDLRTVAHQFHHCFSFCLSGATIGCRLVNAKSVPSRSPNQSSSVNASSAAKVAVIPRSEAEGMFWALLIQNNGDIP